MADSLVIEWSAYEHEFIERGGDWFWALGIFAVCVALISVIVGNALFGLLILLAAATIGMLARIPPELVRFELSEKGVRVGDTLHRYDDIIAFWVEDEGGAAPLLLIDTTKFSAPNLVIPIEKVEPSAVRAFLKRHAEERPMKEPLAHKILEGLGL